MGDTKINYDEQFGMNTFRREICAALEEAFWGTLTDELTLPDMETEGACQCANMRAFMKRYHACHCPFAKESILAGETVSAELCYCSLGHVMNFSEAFLNRALEGKVVRSVLNGDMACEYEITIPEDIMEQYVTIRESQTVIENYYRYYKAFCGCGTTRTGNVPEGI